MKKRKVITLVFSLMACFAFAFGVSACESKHTHSYTQSIVAPTCTEKGYTKHTCSCGDTYSDTYVDALGHSFTNYVSNNNATCEGNCTETAVCDNGCGTEDTREIANSALGHSFTYYVSNNDGTKTAMCDNDCGETDIAIDEYYYTEGLVFEINNRQNVYLVTDYTGTDTKVYVPAVYQNLPVTTIGYSAFYNCSSLTEIVIPESVTTIGVDAFYNCNSLTEVVISDSVTTIGAYAFSGCSNLTEIVIPDSVTTIGKYAFYGCESLTEIVIPDSVTSIGEQTFGNCSSLTEVVIGDNVTMIDDYAFSGCVELKVIVIPNSVTKVGYYAFWSCHSLTIYCEVESQPWSWNHYWNSSNRPVVWGYKGS